MKEWLHCQVLRSSAEINTYFDSLWQPKMTEIENKLEAYLPTREQLEKQILHYYNEELRSIQKTYLNKLVFDTVDYLSVANTSEFFVCKQEENRDHIEDMASIEIDLKSSALELPNNNMAYYVRASVQYVESQLHLEATQ